jgi:hypothetical protein
MGSRHSASKNGLVKDGSGVWLAQPLAAQQDVIRGRIVGPDSQPISDVTVTATALTGASIGWSIAARKDSVGRFVFVFYPGVAIYLVTACAVGYLPVPPREVRRPPESSSFLVFDAVIRR